MTKLVHVGVVVILTACAAACSVTKYVEPSSPPTVSARSEPAETRQLGSVDATILFTDCTAVSNYSASKAEKTMRRLVEGCDSIPGGQAEFIATLQPGGRIELGAVEGTAGTVPICVLKHQLTHQVQVRKACKMHVQMEQRTPTP